MKRYNEPKYKLKNLWTTEMESSTDETGNDENPKIEAPSHYCKYTIQDRTLVVQQPLREPKPNESYDGPENAKKIDLATRNRHSLLRT